MKSLIKLALLGSIVSAISIGAISARADMVVTVLGATYDVTTVTTSFTADKAQLEAQPEWGNYELAFYLAQAVGAQFGTPNNLDEPPNGPVFAVSASPAEPAVDGEYYSSEFGGRFSDAGFDVGEVVTFGLVTPIPETPSQIVTLALALPFLGLVCQWLIRQRR